MAFSNPIWLWALAGLSVPVAIHLLSRKEGKVIRLGSIRHVMDSTSAQFSSIRLNEILLLLVRSLLITWIVILLAGLHFTEQVPAKAKWLIIEKGLENDKDFAALIDSLKQEDFELRILADGFPKIADHIPSNDQSSYWLLAEKLGDENIEQAVVLSYNYVTRFKGKRVQLPSHVKWISKTPIPHEFTLISVQMTNDSLWLRRGNSNETLTRFTTSIQWNQVNNSIKAETVYINLVSDEKFAYEKQLILAALKTIEQYAPFSFHISDISVDTYNTDAAPNWVIWLSHKSNPSVNANLLSIKDDKTTSSNILIQKLGSRHWQINCRLNEEVILQNNFTGQLAELILPREAFIEELTKHDRRTLDDKLAWRTISTDDVETQTTSITAEQNYSWLISLIVLTLLAERLIAFNRRQ